MARKPLGPFSIVPQFEDMLEELGGYVKMPPENYVSDVLDDPIFQALGNMWNRIETSEELVVKHQANQVAFMQGASNLGVPADVMRKLMERVVDQHGATVASDLMKRLREGPVMTTPGAPPPPPGAGGVSVGTATDSAVTRGIGTDAPMMVTSGTDAEDAMDAAPASGSPPDPPSGGAVARIMRDRSTSPDFYPELLPGGRPPSPPAPPSYTSQISRAQGLDASTSYIRSPVDFGLPPVSGPMHTGAPPPPPPPPPEQVYVNPNGRPPPPPPGAAAVIAGHVPLPQIMDVDQDMPVIVRHHQPDGGGGGARIEATDAYNIAEIIRSAMKKEAISDFHMEQAARREAAAAMWMQQMSTQLTSVAEELVRITADKHKLHGADMPEPMELETGPPKPRGPPPPPGAAVSAAPLAAPLAAPPFYAGASSAPVTVAGAPINISIRNERSPDQRTAKVMRIDTPSPERRAKEAAARAEQTAARAEESARKATIDAEVAATRARDAQEREAKAAARARSLENKLQRAEERERARDAKSAERKATEAREAEARAEAKRAREAERAKSAERKAEAKRAEATRAEARAETKRAEVKRAEARERSRTPGGGIPAPPVHVPTDSVDSRELRVSTPDLTPEQEALLALVKQKYGIPDDMSIAEIVEASRRMLAMQAAKKPRSKSGARSSTA